MVINLETLTKKWWFYVLLFFISLFLLPTISDVPFSPEKTNLVIMEVLMYGLIPYHPYAIVFHILTVIIVIGLLYSPQKFIRIFYIYMSINFFLIGIFQNITQTETYGRVILLGNIFLSFSLGLVWLWAGIKSSITPPEKVPRWKYWGLPLAILAFWSPMTSDGQPSLDPFYLLYSDFGLAICFTIPVFLFILSVFHPNVNRPAFRLTAIIGLYFGIMNMMGPLFFPGYPLWVVFLHVPLFSLSIYAIFLEIKQK